MTCGIDIWRTRGAHLRQGLRSSRQNTVSFHDGSSSTTTAQNTYRYADVTSANPQDTSPTWVHPSLILPSIFTTGVEVQKQVLRLESGSISSGHEAVFWACRTIGSTGPFFAVVLLMVGRDIKSVV
jgi:hypothetical protein